LAFLYGERNYLDQSLEHRREELRLSRRAGPRPGESAEEFGDRIDLLDKDTAKLVQMVEQSRKVFAAQSRRLEGNRLAQADLALRLGLVRHAVEEILMKSPPDVLGSDGIRLELDLLLCLGRADQVRDTLSDPVMRENRQNLRYQDLFPPRGADGEPLYAIPYHLPAYAWLRTLQTAAVGDYAEARDEIAAIRAEWNSGLEAVRQQRPFIEDRVLRLVGVMLSGPQPFLPQAAARSLGPYVAHRDALRAGEPALRAQQADLFVLEGLLALEQGDTAAARSAFAEAQARCAGPANEAVSFAGAPISGLYLGKLSARE
jgi:hypothetical protein